MVKRNKHQTAHAFKKMDVRIMQSDEYSCSRLLISQSLNYFGRVEGKVRTVTYLTAQNYHRRCFRNFHIKTNPLVGSLSGAIIILETVWQSLVSMKNKNGNLERLLDLVKI